MSGSISLPEQPRKHCATRLSHKRTRVASAVALLCFLAFSPTRAQNRNSTDVNLSRLAEAVNAISRNDLPRAENLLNSVLVALPGDADALNLLGVVRAQQQKPAEAEKLFRRALVASPDHIAAHVNLGKLLVTKSETAEALPLLLAAHRLAPDRYDINLILATLYADSRDYQQAVEYLRLVPRSGTTDDYFLVLLRSLLGLRRLEEARRLVSEFEGSAVKSPVVQAQFAISLAKAGLTDEAVHLLDSADRQSPSSFHLLYARGLIEAALKQYDKADEHLTEALKAKPDDVTTLRTLANVARSKGNLEKSLAHLIQARRVAPNAPGVLYDFGVTALQMDLLLDALPAFEQLHRDYPLQPAYLYALAAVRWRKGETVETARLMKSYVAMQPRDPAGFYLLGAALLRQDLTSEAQAALQTSQGLKADPNTEYLLGVSLEKAGNRPAAIETFRRVVQQRPDHAAAHAALGAAYREAGNYTEAKMELERALELDANDLRANYQLGLLYAKIGDKEASAKMFARADELRSRQRDQETVILKLVESPQD